MKYFPECTNAVAELNTNFLEAPFLVYPIARDLYTLTTDDSLANITTTRKYNNKQLKTRRVLKQKKNYVRKLAQVLSNEAVLNLKCSLYAAFVKSSSWSTCSNHIGPKGKCLDLKLQKAGWLFARLLGK